MADAPHDPAKRREDAPRPVGGDLILPLAGAAFTLYYFWTIWDLVWEAQVNGLVIGTALLILVAVYLVRVGLDLARGRATLGLGELAWPRDVQVRRGILLVLSVAFIGFIQYLGFTISVALFLVCALYALGVRDRLRLIGLPLLLSLGGYFLFIEALGSRFPHGPLEKLLGALF